MIITLCSGIKVTQEARVSVDVILTLGHFKDAYELLNVRDVKISMLCQIHIFWWMGKIDEWLRYFVWNFKDTLWKFRMKYLTHTVKDVYFI